MLIDMAQWMQERQEPLMKLSPSSDAEYDDLTQQLKLLDNTCPPYDVYNVFAVLFPALVESDSPVAVKRNAEAIEKRNALAKIASRAPLGPPWYTFCLEHRSNEQQRSGYLVRWDKENRKYVCTVMFDSLRVDGMIEYIPNAFQLLLDDDDMFGGYAFDKYLVGSNLDCAEHGATVVRTCIELLNWDREDVPTQTLVNPVWLGTTCGVRTSYPRVDVLRTIPARVRFISAEPLLESLADINLSGIHWLIAGGESGPKFRPMDTQWARELRDSCKTASVGFFFKQESAFRPATNPLLDGRQYHESPSLQSQCAVPEIGTEVKL